MKALDDETRRWAAKRAGGCECVDKQVNSHPPPTLTNSMWGGERTLQTLVYKPQPRNLNGVI
jgi:hypothetical protein